MDKFLNAYELRKLTHGDINHLNSYTVSNEIEAVLRSLPTKKCPRLNGFTSEFY
jgi:hypothetical protein